MGKVSWKNEDIRINKEELLSNMYFIEDDKKFATIEEAVREVENLRAFIQRVRQNKKNEASVDVYVSEVDGKISVGSYRYSSSKRFGGHKVFVGGYEKKVLPHLHVLVKGEGASALCDDIKCYFEKRMPERNVRKIHLKNQEDKLRALKYVMKQGRNHRRF